MCFTIETANYAAFDFDMSKVAFLFYDTSELQVKCKPFPCSSKVRISKIKVYQAIASACTTAFPLPDEALPEATPKKNGDYMTKPEKEMWRINIENAAATVAEQYGNEVVDSVFRRYDAQGLYDLSSCYFSEVFGDLELIANDN